MVLDVSEVQVWKRGPMDDGCGFPALNGHGFPVVRWSSLAELPFDALGALSNVVGASWR
jgi:hypothetical protein